MVGNTKVQKRRKGPRHSSLFQDFLWGVFTLILTCTTFVYVFWISSWNSHVNKGFYTFCQKRFLWPFLLFRKSILLWFIIHSSIFCFTLISHIRQKKNPETLLTSILVSKLPSCFCIYFITILSLKLNKIYENHGHLRCASYTMWWPQMVWYFFNASHVWFCVYFS